VSYIKIFVSFIKNKTCYVIFEKAAVCFCFRIRSETWSKLLMYGDEILSEVLHHSMLNDHINPVISQLHYTAIDRRLTTIIETVRHCIDKYSLHHVVRTDR